MFERQQIDEVKWVQNCLVLAENAFWFSNKNPIDNGTNAIMVDFDDRIAMCKLRWN